MRQPIRELSPSELERYPIRDRLEGWFFRVEEVSIGHYVAEGVDRWRRKVLHEGEDPDQLLEVCIASAEEQSRCRSPRPAGG